LIAADGSLSKDGRHINFTSKDLELIRTFQRCLGLEDLKIGKKSSGYSTGSKYYQVQFGDVLFYKFLQSTGLHSNKSHTIQSVKVPREYFFDFLRGEWDGDGTIHRSRDKRWKNSYVVSIGFTSASIDFLSWLRSCINQHLKTTGFVTALNRGYQLRYAKKDSKKIFSAMFYQENLPHLSRKFAKAHKILTIDESI
jgi:hypothetical protein